MSLLSPFSLTEFFADFYEKAPLHIERNRVGYFDDIYSVAEVEDSLVVGASSNDKFAMVKAGSPEITAPELGIESPNVRWRQTGKSSATTRIDPHRVTAHFGTGYTLIIKDASLFSARLQRGCNAIQRDLGTYAQANVYLTPAGAQGFEVHHDTHDTLTAQIEGEKTWRIYEPIIELPLESQPFASGTKVQGLRLNREVTLKPGDTLYIPRGFPHEAMTTTARSLHVTFALVPVRVFDLIDILMRIAGDTEVDLRRSLTPAMFEDKNFGAHFLETILPRLVAAFTPERADLAREMALNELFRLVRSDARSGFDQIERLTALSDASTVSLKDGVPYAMRERTATVDLLFPGKSLGFPPFCKGALEQLIAGSVRMGDLDPALTPESRTLLVRTLVTEGLLEIQ